MKSVIITAICPPAKTKYKAMTKRKTIINGKKINGISLQVFYIDGLCALDDPTTAFSNDRRKW